MFRLRFTPHDGDRVRLGFTGPAGTLVQCLKKDHSGYYWRVRLDDETWGWPDDAVAESSGSYDCECRECGIAFRDDDINEVFCPNCRRRFAAQDRAIANEPSGPRLHWRHEDRAQGRKRT